MKNTGRYLALSLILGTYAQAAQFLAVGDNAELFVTGSVSVRFDDNIYLDQTNEQDDIIWSIKPGFDLVFGKGSATQGNFYYNEEFQQYSDNNNQDTSLSNIGVRSVYDGGKSKFDFAASYAQLVQNDNDVRATGDLVRREASHFHARPEFGLTEKTSLGIGIVFDTIDYKPASYTDSSIWMLPIDFYSEYTPKLDLSIGYRYRDSSLDGTGVDSQDNFFSVGARGEFTPKLSGQVRVGFNMREFDRGGDDDQIGFESSLDFAASSKTRYQINISNDFGSSASGDSTKNFTLGIIASSSLNQQLSMNAGVTFRAIEYPTRDDDFIEGQIALTYVYNVNVNFGASYVHRNNDSSQGALDFSNNVFTFGANIRY